MTISSTFITPGRGKTARVQLDSDYRNCIDAAASQDHSASPQLPEIPKRHAGSPNHTPSTKQITTDRCGVRWM
jgi:hypothetical protein